MTEHSGLASALENSNAQVRLRADGLAAMALFEDCTPEQLQALGNLLSSGHTSGHMSFI